MEMPVDKRRRGAVRERRSAILGEWKRRPSSGTRLSRSRCGPRSGRRRAWRLAGDGRGSCRPPTMTSAFISASASGLDVVRLLEVVKGLVDDPAAAQRHGGRRLGAVDRRRRLVHDSRQEGGLALSADRIGREGNWRLPRRPYQHGLSAGTSARLLLGDLDGRSRALPAAQRSRGRTRSIEGETVPYPEKLREALIRRFQWEMLFSIENAQTAVPRGDETYIAGCAFRSLACAAQVLFAVNRRYLINEKGALAAAASLPLTVDNLAERARNVWQAIGLSRIRCSARGPPLDRARACWLVRAAG